MLRKVMLACGIAVLFAVSAPAAEFRKFTLGSMEVIALADTDPKAPAKDNPALLVGVKEAGAEKYLSESGFMKGSINCFIVRTGSETILFDTGLGFGANGQLPASLAAAGIDPGAIDAVVITHFHPDHVGGLVDKDGAAAFSTARLMVPRVEVEANPQAAMKFMAAYAGRLHTFEWDHAVADGVVAVDANGHTPGHTVFLIDNGGVKLMIVGDLIHFGGIQLPVPDVAVTYDTDPVKAVAARKRLFDKAAAENYVIASMHLSFPGVGTLSKDGSGYGFADLK